MLSSGNFAGFTMVQMIFRYFLFWREIQIWFNFDNFLVGCQHGYHTMIKFQVPRLIIADNTRIIMAFFQLFVHFEPLLRWQQKEVTYHPLDMTSSRLSLAALTGHGEIITRRRNQSGVCNHHFHRLTSLLHSNLGIPWGKRVFFDLCWCTMSHHGMSIKAP